MVFGYGKPHTTGKGPREAKGTTGCIARLYGARAGDAGSSTLKLIYGITPAERAKTEVTMRFLVENYA